MVVLKKELVNTLFLFTLNSQSSIQESTNILNQQIYIEIDPPRGWPMSSSTNSLRELLTSSNAFSIAYTYKI